MTRKNLYGSQLAVDHSSLWMDKDFIGAPKDIRVLRHPTDIQRTLGRAGGNPMRANEESSKRSRFLQEFGT